MKPIQIAVAPLDGDVGRLVSALAEAGVEVVSLPDEKGVAWRAIWFVVVAVVVGIAGLLLHQPGLAALAAPLVAFAILLALPSFARRRSKG